MATNKEKIIKWGNLLKTKGVLAADAVATDLESAALTIKEREEHLDALAQHLGIKGYLKTQADLTQHFKLRDEITNMLKPAGK